MLYIPDILMTAATLGAMIYCYILGKRLKNFNNLDKGVGGAVAVLSTQVEELKKALETAEKSATETADTLEALSGRAEGLSNRLELHLATLQDIPDKPSEVEKSESNKPPVPNDSEPVEPMFVRHKQVEVH